MPTTLRYLVANTHSKRALGVRDARRGVVLIEPGQSAEVDLLEGEAKANQVRADAGDLTLELIDGRARDVVTPAQAAMDRDKKDGIGGSISKTDGGAKREARLQALYEDGFEAGKTDGPETKVPTGLDEQEDAVWTKGANEGARVSFAKVQGRTAGYEGAPADVPAGLTEPEAHAWRQGHADGAAQRQRETAEAEERAASGRTATVEKVSEEDPGRPVPDHGSGGSGDNLTGEDAFDGKPEELAAKVDDEFRDMLANNPDRITDDDLRAVILDKTGKPAHHRAGREKLLEAARAALEAAPGEKEPVG